MLIKRIAIENFRSIKRVEIFPEKLCALIGENNVGKSNILSAIDLVLGEKFHSPATIKDSDFYDRDRSKIILRDIFLGANEFSVEKIYFRASFSEGNLKTELKAVYSGGGEKYVSRDLKEKFGTILIG